MTDIHYVLASTVLTWVMLFAAPAIRNREWTMEGMKLGFGNRDKLPEPSPMAARADRAAKNMLENMVLFVAAFAAMRAAGKSDATGPAIFFFARVAYWIVYLIGIPYLRTLLWVVSIAGIGMMGLAAIR